MSQASSPGRCCWPLSPDSLWWSVRSVAEAGLAHLRGHHQGAMDLRAGSPTAESRTRSRSLRGTILARPSPSCADDDDRICLPPASPPFNSKAVKKESTGHRPSRLYQPCATPSSNSSLYHHRSDVRIAENGFATSSGVSESAKVVLAPHSHAASGRAPTRGTIR